MQPEVAGWKPPLDRSAQRRSPTPAFRIASALSAARVVDALRETPSHAPIVPHSENGSPVFPDADDRPAVLAGALERDLGAGRVVELALRIVVEHEQP